MGCTWASSAQLSCNPVKARATCLYCRGNVTVKWGVFFLQLSSKMHTWGHGRGRHNPALYLLRNLFSPLTHISKLRRSPLHVSCFSQFPTTANNHPFACRRAAARTLLRIFQVTHSFLAHPGPAEAYFIPKTLKQELLLSVCSSASSCDTVSAHHLSGG